MIWAIFAYVSTLLIIVGFPQTPLWAGKGGLGFGIPRSPSIDLINAVSSPQTKAPAPKRISKSKSNPLSKIFLPNNPNSRACLIAEVKRSTAIGYSARI